MFALLLCVRKSEVGTWTVASSGMAQGASNNAQVPSQRLHTAALEDSGPEKCLCFVEQTTIWLVNMRSHNVLLTISTQNMQRLFSFLEEALKML